MLTRNALADLSESLREQHVLSIYLDGRVTDPAARFAWRSTLAGNLDALRDSISEDATAEGHEFDRCRALLEEQLAPIDGALSALGLVAFATQDRVVLAERLPIAIPNGAHWQLGPWISSYVRAQKELRPVILALVDARSARTYRYALGTLSPLEQFHAHAQVDQPRHMGAAPRQSFHPGTRGATTTDAVDRAREHGTQRMLRELIDHITSAASTDEWIVIGGLPMRAGLVLTMLPAAMRQRAMLAPGLSPVTATSSLRRAAAEQARRLRQRLDRDIIETAIAHAAQRGRGSAGVEDTRAALKINDVHLLMMSTRFMSDRADVAEELARLALAGGASIEVVSPSAADPLDAAGGVAAILRYVVPSTPAETAGALVSGDGER